MFFLVLHFEFCDDKQSSVLDTWKVISTNVPVEGGTVDSYRNGLFDGSSKVVLLPIYYAKSPPMMCCVLCWTSVHKWVKVP